MQFLKDGVQTVDYFKIMKMWHLKLKDMLNL